MPRSKRSTPQLTQLGHRTALPASPEAAVLERVANAHTDVDYLVRFTAPEFTTLCPMTGQPDFAHLVIEYIPQRWLVESKSLKLYLGSFRNQGGFHEQTTIAIAKRLIAAACRSTCSGRLARRRRRSGFRSRGCRRTADGER
jgi:7-cyano-7-deazaguanine reductase